MASNQSIFDRLNLSSGERRLVMFVLVVLMCALAWMVWGMIPDPRETQKKIKKEKTQLISFEKGIAITYTTHKGDTLSTIAKKHKTTAEAIAKANDITPPNDIEPDKKLKISKIPLYEDKIRTLEGLGSAVMPIEQEFTMRRTINNLTAANGVRVTRLGRTTTKTNEFFQEKTMRVDFSSKESDLVNFLWKLGGSESMVRVSDLLIKPDKNRYRLDGWMNLTASYQKDPKATQPKPVAAKPATEAKPEPVAAKSKSEPVAAKSKPAKPETKADETKPAKPKTKSSGNKRTVPKRTIPTRPVRKTQ